MTAPPTSVSQVLVPIHTTLTVNVLPHNYNGIGPYVPTYIPHADGSLTTPLFEDENSKEYAEIMIAGAYLTAFAYTSWKSFSYLRRAAPQARSVFYALLASQLLGLTAVAAVCFGYFDQNANCKAINLVASIAGEISYGLIIPGILGFKVWRILERPRFLLGALLVLQAASVGLFTADLPKMGNSKSFTGDCKPTSRLEYIPYALLAIFIEVAMIAAAFAAAIYRARKRWEMDDVSIDRPLTPQWWRRPSLAPFLRRPSNDSAATATRGFSDPPSARRNRLNSAATIARRIFPSNDALRRPKRKNSDAPDAPNQSSRFNDESREKADGLPPRSPGGTHRTSILSTRGNRLGSGIGEDGIFISSEKAPSVLVPIPERRPSSPVAQSTHTDLGQVRLRPRHSFALPTDSFARLSAVRVLPTKFIHSSRTIFRRVLRDELWSTAFISLTILVSIIISFVGTWRHHLLIGRSIILDASWVIVSILTLRTFGAVIRRAEQSALLREHWENMNTNRTAMFDPTRRILDHVDTLSAMEFANPDDIVPLDDNGSGVEGAIQWREPFQNPYAAADIEAWRRTRRASAHSEASGLGPLGTGPRSSNGTRMNVLPRGVSWGDGDVSPKNTSVPLGPSPSQASRYGAVGTSRPLPSVLQAQNLRMSPPSFSSQSSYWASRTNTTDVALDALRRASVAPSLANISPQHPDKEDDLAVQWVNLEKALERERELYAPPNQPSLYDTDGAAIATRRPDLEEGDVETTPMPHAQMYIPPRPIAPAPKSSSSSSGSHPALQSILRRGSNRRDSQSQRSYTPSEVATEPVPRLDTHQRHPSSVRSSLLATSILSRPGSQLRHSHLASNPSPAPATYAEDRRADRHSRTLSAPNLIPNATSLTALLSLPLSSPDADLSPDSDLEQEFDIIPYPNLGFEQPPQTAMSRRSSGVMPQGASTSMSSSIDAPFRRVNSDGASSPNPVPGLSDEDHT